MGGDRAFVIPKVAKARLSQMYMFDLASKAGVAKRNIASGSRPVELDFVEPSVLRGEKDED